MTSLNPIGRQVERYRPLAAALRNRFSAGDVTKVAVRAIEVPDISEIKKFPRRGNFSLFIPSHSRLAARLVTILMGSSQSHLIKLYYFGHLYYVAV